MRRLPLLLVMFAAVLLLGGCASDQRNQSLITTLNAYANTMRWGDFRTALQFVDPKEREAHPPSALDMERYKQLKVSDYNDDAGPKPSAENEVRQTVQINLVNVHTQSERSVIDHQVWRYDPQEKRWWLMSGLPDITGE